MKRSNFGGSFKLYSASLHIPELSVRLGEEWGRECGESFECRETIARNADPSRRHVTRLVVCKRAALLWDAWCERILLRSSNRQQARTMTTWTPLGAMLMWISHVWKTARYRVAMTLCATDFTQLRIPISSQFDQAALPPYALIALLNELSRSACTAGARAFSIGANLSTIALPSPSVLAFS